MYYLLKNNEIVNDNNWKLSKEDFIAIQKWIRAEDVAVIKQSENILDLVEEKDLIQYEHHNDRYIIEVISISSNKIFLSGIDSRIYFSAITAIYKKQPNGDFKRYEVSNAN